MSKTNSKAAKLPKATVAGSPWRLSKESNSSTLVVYNRHNPKVGAIAYNVANSINPQKDRDLVRNEYAKTSGVVFNDTNVCTLGHYKTRFDRRG